MSWQNLQKITIILDTLCFVVIVDTSTQSLSRIFTLLLFAKFALGTDLNGDFAF